MLQDPELLLRFTPVPLARSRASGWTAQRQVAFIAALARTAVVKAAADSVGMTARSAYQLRARAARTADRLVDVALPPEDLAAFGAGWTFSFAHAWDLALARGLDLQMEAALPVALEPERTPIIRRGQVVGWRDAPFNSKLALHALSAWRRYNEGDAYDHELRIARRTQGLAESLEAFFDKGPAEWPVPPSHPGYVCPACAHDACAPPDGAGNEAPAFPDPPDAQAESAHAPPRSTATPRRVRRGAEPRITQL